MGIGRVWGTPSSPADNVPPTRFSKPDVSPLLSFLLSLSSLLFALQPTLSPSIADKLRLEAWFSTRRRI